MREAAHTASKSKTRKSLYLNSYGDEDWPCLVCTEPFNKSKPGEQWIQCSCCLKWAHEDCTPGISANYICHNCNSDDDI